MPPKKRPSDESTRETNQFVWKSAELELVLNVVLHSKADKGRESTYIWGVVTIGLLIFCKIRAIRIFEWNLKFGAFSWTNNKPCQNRLVLQ